ncbi:MAG: XRE family transcriptional regulator [Bacteroidetes bacterium QH_8_67_23]|nr:MAG: XRE family transcriptional regulator [Bacteroidetes bacterium QH_8_67_23]
MTPTEEHLLPQEQLAHRARAARREAGLTQREAARALGVNQANVSKAENDVSGRYGNLQRRMMRELAGWRCEGPYWRVIES